MVDCEGCGRPRPQSKSCWRCDVLFVIGFCAFLRLALWALVQ